MPGEVSRLLARLSQGQDLGPEDTGSELKSIARLLSPTWIRLIALSFATRLAFLALVLVGGQILSGSRSTATGLSLALAYLAISLAHNGVTYFADQTRAKATEGAILVLVTRLAAKLQLVDLSTMGADEKSTLKVLLLSDIRDVAEFLSSLLWNLLPVLLGLVLFTPLILQKAGWAGMAGIVVAMINVPISMLLARWMGLKQDEQQRHLDRMTETASAWLQNLRLVRYLGWQEAITKALRGDLDAYMRPFIRRHALACLTFGISFAWWMVPILAMLASARWLGTDLSAQGVFLAIWLLRDLSEYVQHLPHTFSLMANSKIALKRISRITGLPDARLNLRPRPLDFSAAASQQAGGVVAVHLVDVSHVFAGAAGQTALRNLNLSIDLRQKNLIIGQVASGKSTLLKLLAAEMPPSAGRIEIEIADGRRYDLWCQGVYEYYRASIAVSPQEPFISNDSIQTNIALSDEAESSILLQAFAAAQLDGDMLAFADGLNTEIGERGVTLSGGQRQRLALARAFYANTEVLLLDDSLSAVDPRTEAVLVETLLARGRGLILVSHRLQHVQGFDRVIGLKDGTLVEDGRVADLAAAPHSLYSALKNLSQQAGVADV